MLKKLESDISLESKTIYHSNFHYSKKKRAREKGGKKKKKERHYFSELHATFIILPEVPHRDCVEGRKMKTAVEVLGYTAAPCCLWPLPTSAVCSNPGRECPYLLPLTKASLLPLGIIKTVVCLSAKLLQQLQKVIESATRLAPRAVTQRGCPCWDSSTARGAWDRQGLQGWEPWCPPIGLALSSHPRAPLSPLCFFPFNFCYTCLTTKKASPSVNPLLKIGCIIFGRGFGSQGRF